MKDIDKELSTILRKVVLFDEEDKLETELIENIKELFKESVPAETLVMPKTELSLADTQWLIQNIDKAINSAKQAGQVEPEVMLKLADILQILDDEEYTVSVHSNDTIDDKISESIANTAIIDFKKQLKQELLSKFSA